jgi:hypothetical protein
MTKYLGNAKTVGYSRVAEAAAAYVTEHDGEVDLWSAYDGLARQLGTYEQPPSGYGRQATERFRGQVRRAFDTMTTRGELIKVGRDDHAAQRRIGRSYGAEPRYYTADAHVRALARQAARMADHDALTVRWAVIHDELAMRGYRDTGDRNKAVSLDLDSWERLLGLVPAEGMVPR